MWLGLLALHTQLGAFYKTLIIGGTELWCIGNWQGIAQMTEKDPLQWLSFRHQLYV